MTPDPQAPALAEGTASVAAAPIDRSATGNRGAAAPVHDVAPLAWVIDEIRASLTEATSRIKSYLGNKADVDGLRTAVRCIHEQRVALR